MTAQMTTQMATPDENPGENIHGKLDDNQVAIKMTTEITT
jgi:hypothetical protein